MTIDHHFSWLYGEAPFHFSTSVLTVWHPHDDVIAVFRVTIFIEKVSLTIKGKIHLVELVKKLKN